MLRRSLVVSMVAVVVASNASAQGSRDARSRQGPAREQEGGVSFTPASELLHGVTFTPAAAMNHGVTFVPGPLPLPGVTFTPVAARTMEPVGEAPARATVPTASEPIAPSECTATVAVDLPPHAAATEMPRATEPAQVEPAAVQGGAYGCALEGEVARVDLAAGAMQAVQVALATRGRDAVALVSLARPGGPRDGLVFPMSRVVWIPAAGAPRVTPGPGFEPDATIAVGPSETLLVVSRTRLDARGDAEHARPSVRVAVLDANGAVVGGPRVLDDSAGLEVDSPVVAWREGFAVVLGRESVDAQGARGPVREWLHLLGPRGESIHAPWLLTDAQSDDSIGRFRVGLGVLPATGELVASWTVAAGPDAGVWTLRLAGDALGPATRLIARAAWGSEVAHDGSGVLYRTGGERDAPVQLFYTPWRGRDAFPLGAGWDPMTAFVHGRVLVAGVALMQPGGEALDALLAASVPGSVPRAVPAPRDAASALGRAVDVDMATTDDGAVLAWIEGGDEEGAAPRRLAVARVVCR